jgi:hypothetical protein
MPWWEIAELLRAELERVRGPEVGWPRGWVRHAFDYETYAAMAVLHDKLKDGLAMPPMPAPTYLGEGPFSDDLVESHGWNLNSALDQAVAMAGLPPQGWLLGDAHRTDAEILLVLVRDALDCN